VFGFVPSFRILKNPADELVVEGVLMSDVLDFCLKGNRKRPSLFEVGTVDENVTGFCES